MKNKNDYKRGSTWRKWDLHVHTPEAKLNNQYKCKSGQDVWGIFCKKIEDSDVTVFGITDYFSVDNYFTFIKKFKAECPASKKVFFPNVEFRTESKNGEDEHIQFHVIFSNNQTTLDKLSNFFTRLKLISTDNQNLTNRYCTGNNLSEVGYDKAMVKIDAVEEKLKNDFTDDEYLIIGVANGYGSLRPNGSTDGRGAEYAKELDKKCNLFFGSSKNTDFFLNKIIGRGEYSLLPKPVLFGCDAHSFEILDKKLGKSFEEKNEQNKITDYAEITWIKADPTFEGLKQIVYEPEDRVKIQELKPEEKNVYETIDRVKFVDGSFTPSEILINQNLTAIIGGKSTGKSILLRNIAQTIDPNEVSRRLEEVGLPKYKEEVTNFQVTWKDDQINEKDGDTGVSKKIIYIPQSYLNRLVDKKEDKTSIDEIIKNVLEQEEDVKNVFTKLQAENREVEKTITQNIEDLFYKESDIRNLSEKIKDIGDKKGIESEIKKLKKEVSELKKKSGMTEKELKQYDQLISKSVKLNNKKELYQKDLEALEKVKDQKFFTLPFLGNLSEKLQKTLKNDFFSIKEKYQSEWTEKLNKQISSMQKSDLDNDKQIADNDKQLNPLVKKVVESKSLNEKIKKLEEEERKRKHIVDQEKILEIIKTAYVSLIKSIAENHSRFFDNFFSARAKILEQRSITKDQDLEFGIEIPFEGKSFQTNFIDDVCNLKTIGGFKEGLLQNYIRSSNSGFKNEIEIIINGILDKELTLKNLYSKKEAITRLTKPWFTFDYKIKQNGDEISEMSPGKKSFVLLKLLIELDNSRCPILLDQPEDDLDNRSIYNDLVKFINRKKKGRQIIIATHNPNLVVGADSGVKHTVSVETTTLFLPQDNEHL
jgi:ABC-type cobalamin/Fe3+-siderophores transport system ATPase subunit